jgi:hypothetical protein
MKRREKFIIIYIFFPMLLQPLWALVAFQCPDLFTIGRTLWRSDQLVARPLPKHRTEQTQNKHIHTPNIHALSGVRAHDHSVRASEDSSCLRPLGYRDRHHNLYPIKIVVWIVFDCRSYVPNFVTFRYITLWYDPLNAYKTMHVSHSGANL